MNDDINFGLLHEDFYMLSNGLKLKNFNVQDMLDVGEDLYYRYLHLVICTASELIVTLYDKGIDFRDVDDYDIFISNVVRDGVVNNEFLKIFIPDCNFELLSENNNIILKDNSNMSYIDKHIHYEVVNVLRTANGLTINKNDIFNPANKTALDFMVEIEKEKQEIREMMRKQGHHKDEFYKNSLFYNIIPVVVNHVNNGITYDNIKSHKIFEVLESYEMLNLKIKYDFNMSGVCAGTIKYKPEFSYLRK